jgi:hypothetical protein
MRLVRLLRKLSIICLGAPPKPGGKIDRIGGKRNSLTVRGCLALEIIAQSQDRLFGVDVPLRDCARLREVQSPCRWRHR